MNCREFQLLINMEIDGQLPERVRPQLEAHLAVCADCSAYLAQLQQLNALLYSELEQVEPPADFASSVMSALAQPEREPQLPVALPTEAAAPKKKRRRVIWRAGVSIAAVLLLLVGLSGIFHQERLQPDSHIIASNDKTTQPTLPQSNDNNEDSSGPLDTNPHSTDTTDPDSTGSENLPQPQTDNPTTVENPDKTNDTANSEDDAVTYIHGVPLPSVATNSHSSGNYNRITLASYNDYNAILPQVEDGMVTYYVEMDGLYLKWQVDSSGSMEPQFIEEVSSLPEPASIGRYNSTVDIDPETGEERSIEWYEATSAEGIVAKNSSSGLFLVQADGTGESLVAPGGGTLISWSPDGNKLLFTDASGTLQLYYPTEDLLLTIMSDVSSACWNGATELIFAAYDSSTGYSSIFRVTIP